MKKGIMLDFLVTVLLAIIIFAPACVLVSKFTRLSTQAKENFNSFDEVLHQMQKAPDGERRTTILILDKETAAVYFEPLASELRVDVDANCVGCEDYFFTVSKPASCNNEEKACLCLFREVSYSGGSLTTTVFNVKSEEVVCDNLEPTLKMPVCGVGKANDVNAYHCQHGFLIEREIVKESSWHSSNFFEAPRRIVLQLSKEGDNVVLEPK